MAAMTGSPLTSRNGAWTSEATILDVLDQRLADDLDRAALRARDEHDVAPDDVGDVRNSDRGSRGRARGARRFTGRSGRDPLVEPCRVAGS